MKRLLLILLCLALSIAFFSCNEPPPPPEPWQPWNEVVHRDTLAPGQYFEFQLETTKNWDTAYFAQPASQGWCEIFITNDSASYYKLMYHPEYSYTGLDTIEVELKRTPGIWDGETEFYNHFFYFNIQATGGQ